MRTEFMSRPKSRHAMRIGTSGFTLIELLVTVSIIGILSAIAVPSFRELVAGQQIKTASFEVMSMLMLARSEAIKRNASVVAAATGGWQNGWTVTAADGTVLQRQSAFPDSLTITGSAGSLTYNNAGRLTDAVAPTFSLSSSSSSNTRCISIDLSGRPNSKTGSC